MTIAAKISAIEVEAQVTNRFVDKYLEARLIDAAGVTYTPGLTDDATFLAQEVTAGFGGYKRQVIGYSLGDVSTYSDSGIGLSTKATVFPHDGGGDVLSFSHAVLVWSTGNVLTIGALDSVPTAAVDGTYTNIPISSTNGNGVGATVDITVTNSGASTGDYAVTLSNAGYDYAVTDTLVIDEGTLAGLGMVTAGAGGIGTTVGSINNNSENAGDIMSVAQTTNTVNLTAGNEAVFYWNLKQFGLFTLPS